jgi:hypothetical protein
LPYAIAPLYAALEGVTFPDALSAERAARRLLRRQNGPIAIRRQR